MSRNLGALGAILVVNKYSISSSSDLLYFLVISLRKNK